MRVSSPTPLYHLGTHCRPFDGVWAVGTVVYHVLGPYRYERMRVADLSYEGMRADIEFWKEWEAGNVKSSRG